MEAASVPIGGWMDKENAVRTHSQVTDSKIFGNWATTLYQRLCAPPTTQDSILFHQWWVNQFILPLVFNHFFQYHFMLVETLQEAGAKTRREMQENMRGEGASVREKGESARGGREGCQTMPFWPHEGGRRRQVLGRGVLDVAQF